MPSFNTLPAELDVNLIVGDEWSLSLDFDIDLTGYQFSAKVFVIDRTVNSSFPGGINTQGVDVETITVSHTDLASGLIGLSLTEAQTGSLDETETYRWYLRGVAPGTITRTYISGAFAVRTP